MEKIRHIKSPFTFYDVFGYLMPGLMFIALWLVEYDVGDLMNYYVNNEHCPNSFDNYSLDFTEDLKIDYVISFFSWGGEGDFKFIPFFLFLLLTYLMGHVIAAMSSFLLEKQFVKRFLGYPSILLFEEKEWEFNQSWKTLWGILNHVHRFILWTFSDFLKIYSPNLRTEMQDLIRKRFGEDVMIENYFWLCFSDIAKYNSVAYSRVLHFLNLYGFARNVTMSILLYVAFRFSVYFILGSDLNAYNFILLGVYLVVSFIMFWNYLKLFRRQCSEMYFHFYSLHRSDVVKDNPGNYSFSYQTRT